MYVSVKLEKINANLLLLICGLAEVQNVKIVYAFYLYNKTVVPKWLKLLTPCKNQVGFIGMF